MAKKKPPTSLLDVVDILKRSPLTAADNRALRRACRCPDDAKRGEACTGRWMRCTATIDEWVRIVERKRAALEDR